MPPPPTPILATGTYVITSVSTGLEVARAPAEDKSLLPKKVVLLPAGVQGAAWYVVRNYDGIYTLQNKSAPVVDIDDKLFAQLMEQDPPLQTRWRISSVNWQGADQWIVENLARTDGWLLDSNTGPTVAYKQIDVGPLIANLSLPPQYPANERFVFKRIH
ncbi:hypothetical protein H072_7306 [Dactylellina haptotyla CBS 200.50]|uniref:Ricin B lectin domain-containing protein n=1 Tax=Dactylellina haptotyla (strain CBS 200.50) TaxID=1284197 RepID=S8A7W7_DACHA|nr:hypothetical protein H072_7306 [Dactylellina haptotyla CBS 200.50]